ncbi:hypothetical protein [Streptomyces sp. NBC_01237]|uniref:hypothetical protein n=1 Tax=Streptomyces sp. NBC_01237 TaxID=2903790 RepID=UPI002DDC2B33|nr:hypothetical protein [Streptomyces sp. NBC_01237]WRZ72855.1 hypothetical protein OG251_15155 [Streptomyces sp. NBC_01237]
MPEKKIQHWTESLFDSVYALYETAREYQTAHRAAQVAVQTVDVDRRKLHEGRVALRGLRGRADADYYRTRRTSPHEKAVFGLYGLYSRSESELRHRYDEAAHLFASGAAWAVGAVQGGETPDVVEFNTDEASAPTRHQLSITGLGRYAGAGELTAAYDQWYAHMCAAEYAEDLAGRDYVSDHEAGQMHDAIGSALGLADSAFAYGLLAQRAVSFVLLEPRRARQSELAAARAAAQSAQLSN